MNEIFYQSINLSFQPVNLNPTIQSSYLIDESMQVDTHGLSPDSPVVYIDPKNNQTQLKYSELLAKVGGTSVNNTYVFENCLWHYTWDITMYNLQR